jgi:hypothetical protein|tara:strand:+ start:883 stop:1290 length:408 start_codon:yes stop_codon:yes gene_type:complete
MSNFQNQRGISLYIALMVMTILLGIALGTSSILFSQIGVLRGIGYSVFAFYATDAGVERALYIDNSVCATQEQHAPCLQTEFNNIPPEELVLNNGASYTLLAENGGESNCPPENNYCVRSAGSYQQALRAIRVAR